MKRIFIDKDKCDGCKSCSVACMQSHRETPGTLYDLDLMDPANESRNFILPGEPGDYTPLFCRHCDEPECVNACISGAMSKDPETGLVSYDKEHCASCFLCVMHCPFGVLKADRVTGSRVVRCDFCAHDPEGPNCVRACPKNAIYVEEVKPL